jgi:hypothetical protein
MGAVSQSAAVGPQRQITGRNGFIDRYFSLAMALFMAAITIYGFSFTVRGSLLQPAVPRPLLLWVHAVAFSAWVALYILQSALVAGRNVALHRKLGWIGAALGVSMVPLGYATAIMMARFHIHRLHENPADFQAWLFSPLYDMTVFGVLVACAIFWRRRPDVHRRLMLLASLGLMTAPISRFPVLNNLILPGYLTMDALFLLVLLRDFAVDRKLHRAHIYALPALAVTQALMLMVVMHPAQWWVSIAHRILG